MVTKNLFEPLIWGVRGLNGHQIKVILWRIEDVERSVSDT